MFAKMLQQAIGGVEGEIRVAMQYLFSGVGLPGAQEVPRHDPPDRYGGARPLAPVTEDGPVPAEGRWSSGPSIDGKGEFSIQVARPLGDEPVLPAPIPEGFAQTSQMTGAPDDVPRSGPRRRPSRAVAWATRSRTR